MKRQTLRHQAGVTLVQMMMVLIFAGSILYFSVKQYQSWQLDANVQQVKSNIDQISLAAAQFVVANCNANGILDPANYSGSSYSINVENNLIKGGYLTQTIPLNPIVNNSGPTGSYNGYTVQLNKVSVPRAQCTAGTTTSCTTTTTIGTVVLWSLQVGIKLTNPAMSSQLQSLLAANCVTSVTRFDTLVDCSSAASFSSTCQAYRNTPPIPPAAYAAAQAAADAMGCPSGTGAANYNNYLAVQRTSASPTTNADSQSPMWVSNPAVQQFKQMYNTYPMTNLTSQSHTPEFQYFNCGSYK